MSKKKPALNNSESFKYNKDSIDSKKKDFINHLSRLSYEESLEELDLILNKIQNESLLVEELQITYIKATLYLEHCEKLLDIVEQEVVEINSKDIASLDDNN